MAKKRVLLMYISQNSGHQRASLAVENALHELSDDVESKGINSFNYTNPILEKIVNRAYMGVIRRKPEVWGYLYDNPGVVKKTQRLRDAIHKYNSQKMKNLLEGFKPHAVVCTQAFPCGIVADYKKTSGLDVVLAGVLTDYAPHAYWIYDNVDFYFVPSEETKGRIVSCGIPEDRVRLTGIPIRTEFKKIIDTRKIRQGLDIPETEPIVLVMGGSQGMGPIKEIVKVLGGAKVHFRIIVVTGANVKLHNYLKRRVLRFGKKMTLLGYAENIDELMSISSLIISKPGGITISESLAKGLPLLIVKPIPGHEKMNTDHLVKNKVAIKVDRLCDLEAIVTELLGNPVALRNMRERATALSRPDSAVDIARTILQRIM